MKKMCVKCVAYENCPTSGFGYCHRYPRPANARLKVDDNDYCMEFKPKKKD